MKQSDQANFGSRDSWAVEYQTRDWKVVGLSSGSSGGRILTFCAESYSHFTAVACKRSDGLLGLCRSESLEQTVHRYLILLPPPPPPPPYPIPNGPYMWSVWTLSSLQFSYVFSSTGTLTSVYAWYPNVENAFTNHYPPPPPIPNRPYVVNVDVLHNLFSSWTFCTIYSAMYSHQQGPYSVCACMVPHCGKCHYQPLNPPLLSPPHPPDKMQAPSHLAPQETGD